jgi:hypothetical protein
MYDLLPACWALGVMAGCVDSSLEIPKTTGWKLFDIVGSLIEIALASFRLQVAAGAVVPNKLGGWCAFRESNPDQGTH